MNKKIGFQTCMQCSKFKTRVTTSGEPRHQEDAHQQRAAHDRSGLNRATEATEAKTQRKQTTRDTAPGCAASDDDDDERRRCEVTLWT